MIGTFLNRGGFPVDVEEHKVVFSDPIFGGKMYNNYYHKSGGGSTVYLETSSEKKDVIREESPNALTIIQWIIFGISGVVIFIWVIYIYSENVEIISKSSRQVTMMLSSLEKDDEGKYCYVCLDRVVGNPRGTSLKSEIPSWKDFPRIWQVKFLSKFYSKAKNRLNNLNKIGL